MLRPDPGWAQYDGVILNADGVPVRYPSFRKRVLPWILAPYVMLFTIFVGAISFSQILAFSGITLQMIMWASSLDFAPIWFGVIMLINMQMASSEENKSLKELRARAISQAKQREAAQPLSYYQHLQNLKERIGGEAS